ncbi:MAG: proline--tRNA ligase [Mycoplasmoidaceae bacterium]
MENKKIVKRSVDFAKWYTSIISEANLIEYGLVKGTIIFKPYSWLIWTNIQDILNSYFKNMGIENCSMPLFIPYSDFTKEAKHIKGFAPELFKISELCGKKLEDPYVIRPTSEIMFCHYFSNNIHSYNDLPLILNQWSNVFRVEKNTRPFLRTSEFFWQEQHGIFSNEEDALSFTKKMIDLYKKFMEEYLCIPVLMGKKTEYERFAGADETFTIEAIMQDGQALQCGTSHYLGQNFSKNFNIKFQNKDNKFEYGFQNSAGVSTRLIGAIIMSHSDDNGLVLPPKIAPIQVKINSLFADKCIEVKNLCEELSNKLSKKFNVKIDDTNKSIGFKLSEGEVSGIPIQINIGPKDLENNSITLFYRQNREKEILNIKDVDLNFIEKKLELISKELYKKAKENLDKRIFEVSNLEDFNKHISLGNVVLAFWSGTEKDEKKLKETTGASSRCISDETKSGTCFFTGKKTNLKVFFARAY